MQEFVERRLASSLGRLQQGRLPVSLLRSDVTRPTSGLTRCHDAYWWLDDGTQIEVGFFRDFQFVTGTFLKVDVGAGVRHLDSLQPRTALLLRLLQVKVAAILLDAECAGVRLRERHGLWFDFWEVDEDSLTVGATQTRAARHSLRRRTVVSHCTAVTSM